MIFLIVLAQADVSAQQKNIAAYDKLMQLTGMFQGKAPYSCLAIVVVKYQKTIVRDTSKLIYKNGATFYRSKLVERVEGPQGELVINHELKTATLQVSDSIKQEIQKELKVTPNREFEALLDSNFEERDEEAFRNFLVRNCDVLWDRNGDVEEIAFSPNKEYAGATVFSSMRIKFRGARVLYYEYTNKEAYTTDWNGNNKFRTVTTIYDGFSYDNVPDIPYKLNDYLQWDGWSVQLKKYTNYKFSLL